MFDRSILKEIKINMDVDIKILIEIYLLNHKQFRFIR